MKDAVTSLSLMFPYSERELCLKSQHCRSNSKSQTVLTSMNLLILKGRPLKLAPTAFEHLSNSRAYQSKKRAAIACRPEMSTDYRLNRQQSEKI
jgi:hypothetical protein